MARLATDVVVLSHGKVVASGPTGTIMQRLDLLPAEERGEGGAVLDTTVLRHDEAFSMTVLGSVAGEIRVPRLAVAVGAPVRVRIRARDVMIATELPIGLSALNILPGTIIAIEPGEGPAVEVGINCKGATVLARITEQSRQTLKLRIGRKVFAVVKTVSFDHANTGAGLPAEADG